MVVWAMLLIYIALLITAVYLQIMALKSNHKKWWVLLYMLEVLSAAISYMLSLYFDSLPGTGMAPGLTYIGEVIYSLSAAFIYGCCLFISIIIGGIYYLVRHKTSSLK
jgi:hypothetical protein